MLCAGGVSAIINTSLSDTSTTVPWLVFAGIMTLAVAVVVADIYAPRKRIDTITAIYFGVLIGVLLTYVLSIALAPMLSRSFNAPVIQLVMALILCYICTSVLLQTKDDFRFLIPYVEFVREVKGFKTVDSGHQCRDRWSDCRPGGDGSF